MRATSPDRARICRTRAGRSCDGEQKAIKSFASSCTSASSAAHTPASRSDSPADPTANQRVVGIDVAAPVVVEKTSKRSIGIMTLTYLENTAAPNSELESFATFPEDA